MKKVNKLLAVLAAIAICFAVSGCAAKPEPSPAPVPVEETPVTVKTEIKVAALKGPTAMGMAKMLTDSDTANTYNYNIYGTADEIAALIIKGELDVAAVPSNLASVLYNKTDKAISLAAVNTLGVLDIIENGDSIKSVEDLKGKTIYAAGNGSIPQYALEYVLNHNGIDPNSDVTIEYKSEATEIAALLTAEDNEGTVAMLPQPYVTNVLAMNDSLRIALDLTEEWDKVSDGSSSLVTGVVIVSNKFLKENPEAFEAMMDEYKASTEFVNENNADAAVLIEQLDIAKAAVAEKALPYCNITFMTGDEMENAVSGFLTVLFEQNPNSIGGVLPDEGFYLKTK